MKSSKKQAIIMTGVGLILLAFILLYYALSQPKVNSAISDTLSTAAASAYSEALSSQQGNSTSGESEVYSSDNATYSYEEAASNNEAVNASYPVNLNTCTADELAAIEGIGDSRAQAIIQYREYLGSYSSVEQIKEIKGIGDGIYEKISPYLTV